MKSLKFVLFYLNNGLKTYEKLFIWVQNVAKNIEKRLLNLKHRISFIVKHSIKS